MNADDFLAQAHHFHLGSLPTEMPHALTQDLSRLAQEDLPQALRILRQVDLLALERMQGAATSIDELRQEIAETLRAQRRIFLCGCGATGRLSVSLEVLWRETATAGPDAVVAFMAGGDVALIRSIENFEDHPEYGARHLEDVGFRDGDLLIACTEGGETPYVIGACEHAARLSSRSPWFLYCNPDDVLGGIERSRRVLESPAIRKISLFVGPMALCGSTRMQASTVLMLAVGMALLPRAEANLMQRLRDCLERTDPTFLQPFIEYESRQYEQGGHVLYDTDRFGITIMTDTTERAPTFSLRAFENSHDAAPLPSLCFLHQSGTDGAAAAWHKLLHRAPRPLDWSEVQSVAGLERLLGFDFSDRSARRALSNQATFRITAPASSTLHWELGDVIADVRLEGLSLLEQHLLLKMLLNIHSTLVMGRLGRYVGNLMTYVRPSNNKLIDRSIRYVQWMLGANRMAGYTYEDVARCCFEEMGRLGEDEPIVLKVYQALIDGRR